MLSRLNLTDLAYEKKAPPKVVFKGSGRNALNMNGASTTTPLSESRFLILIAHSHQLPSSRVIAAQNSWRCAKNTRPA